MKALLKKSKINTASENLLTTKYLNDLVFYINEQKHEIQNPDPTILLIDYLRSTKVGLTGTKHSCGQGGCGACTVLLTYWDQTLGKAVTVSCNSCLRLLVSLHGMSITTTEGLGSVNTELSPVQYSIAKNNGSQCGYCTPGFVMNMHALLMEKKGQRLSQKEIEQSFDGNICRCTGFRPILYAMKTFATDWTAKDEAGTPPCLVDPAENVRHYKKLRTIDEKKLSKKDSSLYFAKAGIQWYQPLHLVDVHTLMREHPNPSEIKLVCGNTSQGIPLVNPVQPSLMIDISRIAELKGIKVTDNSIMVGASTTYTEFLNLLQIQLLKTTAARKKGFKALEYMALRTAGKIVRNVASLAGNTMLVARNVKSGYPFPSDLYVGLSALGTEVSVSLENETQRMLLTHFIDVYNEDHSFARQAILMSYHIPYVSQSDYIQTYKVALRLENSHSLANAGFKISLDKQKKITAATLVIGGITPKPLQAIKTEEYLLGKTINNETLTQGLKLLASEIKSSVRALPKWFLNLPSEGISATYRLQLVESYFYKFMLEVLFEIDRKKISPQNLSGLKPMFDRPVSSGRQNYVSDPKEWPVSAPIIKLSAFEQATGEAEYTHDIPLPVRGLQGAFVISTHAHGTFRYQIPLGVGRFKSSSAGEVLSHVKEKYKGIVAFFTHTDIPKEGKNGNLPSPYPDPMFCVDEVTAYGQCIGLLVAEDETTAVSAAAYISNQCIQYTPLSTPVLDIRTAVKAGSIFSGYTQKTDDNQKITKPGSSVNWALKTGAKGLAPGFKYKKTKLNGIECFIIAGTQETGDQIHFYMETQSSFASPGEYSQVLVHPSSQSPASVQESIAHTLHTGQNGIEIDIKRLGGGYGGKTTRTPYVASPVALASLLLRRPIRIAMPRDIDSYMIGHRHPFLGAYNIAVVPEGPDKGKILGTVYEFYSNGGNTVDCSFDVMDCAVLGADNCYQVANFQTEGFVCRTNRTSNGAMRSYGGVQSGLICEESIEAAAFKIGMLPEDLREKNFYVVGDRTPYGQSLDYCIIREVWDHLRKKSEFDDRVKAVEKFNAENRWKKRGISMIPLKYGLGYNLGYLMQGSGKIDIYTGDGSILVSHGGVEMGQGVMTKIAQITAETLNVPLGLIQLTGTRTSVIPNAIGTGATSSTDLNGGAVREACAIQRKKLEDLCLRLLQQHGSKWCKDQGINYWDHKEGWQAKVKTPGNPEPVMIWNYVISQAYKNRVELSSQALYRTPGLSDSLDQQFYGFTYSACCSEVEIDVLTGESNVLRTDMMYDIGQSLNPAIDIGQIEGAYVMGLGYVLSEKLVWEPPGTPNPTGKLNTPNTWTYKPPCAASIPIDFRVDLFPREDALRVPENPNELMSSKGVGEPPLVLANTVFFAVKHAVLAARKEVGLQEWFQMEAPATVEEIRKLCNVDIPDLTFKS